MISVITVVWNGATTIEDTILSVINQDYPDVEYIVIDGVSTDGTLDILEKYRGKISKIISESDKGIYDAMNKGIINSTGDWIYFLGCDDIFYNQSTLSKIFSKSTYDPYDVIYGSVLLLHSQKVYDGKFDYEKMCNRSICHQAIFYRKSLFSKQSYFTQQYKTAADYVFNLTSFCSDNDKWLFIDEIIAIYNETGTSGVVQDKKFLNDNFSIRYDHFRPLKNKPILARIFWSSYFRYLLKHDIRLSLKYLSSIIKEVGVAALFKSLFNSIKAKMVPSNN